jgi:hypothetical protein
MTPIQRDTQRKQAELASRNQQVFTPAAANAGGLDRTMRYKLGSDRARLKKIASMQRKAEVKGEIIPEYLPYLDGVMAAGGGDEVLTQVMVWALDADKLDTFETLARYALDNGVAMPTEFSRPLGAWIAESVAKTILRIIDGTLITGHIQTMQALCVWVESATTNMDMHDEIRAKLHSACGEVLSTESPVLALEHFETALQLDRHIRVKKRIAALKEQLSELNESQHPQGQAADGSDNSVATPPHAVENSTTDPLALIATDGAQ